MKIIKAMILAEMLDILTISMSENGFVKLIGLAVLVILGIGIAAKMDKIYDVRN